MGILLFTFLGLLSMSFAQDGSEIPDFLWDEVTHLDEYVHREDGHFSWYIHDTLNYPNVKVYLVNMTSQKWLDETRVSRSIWWHMMGIAVPDELSKNDTGFLFIDGSSNSNPEDWPGRGSYFNLGISLIANETGMVSAWMQQVPNQRIVFYDDPTLRERSEDSIIAYTWKWVVDRLEEGNENPDLDIVLRCPMTKAGKRGLDAIAEVAASEIGAYANISKFIVAGASKRGWTAWTVAATDRRVIATAPLVFSLLYFEQSFMGHYQAMDGAWSFALGPYYNENLTLYLNDPIVSPIYDIEDPFRFRTRLAGIPKLVISATGDEFFLCQDSHYWWDLLGGQKLFMMNPNAEHVLFPHWFRILDTILSWAMTIVFEGPEYLPSVEWTREDLDGFGRVTYVTDQEPVRVRGMVAETLDNHTRRDFRLIAGHPDQSIQPVRWFETPVDEGEEPLTYVLEEDYPEGDIWKGFFVEGQWPSIYFDRDMWFTSEVQIIPDTLPRDECTTAEECYGYLV